MWSTGLALALASSVLLPLLGHKLLTDWDEGIYAEISREMLRNAGDISPSWLVPHWNGQPWFEKPPLMLWITAVFFRAFGVSEFWARAGSALSGVAVVGLLHGWIARCNGPLAAWIGTVALLSTTGFLHICRAGEMDALLSLGCVVSLLGLVAVGERRFLGWPLFWGGFAIAAMTKGSAAVVLPLTVAALALVERWSWRRFGLSFSLGLAGFALLVLPWHLFLWHRFGAAFLREYLGVHTLVRATHAIEGHRTPWWYYGTVLAVSAMPWVLVWPFAAWHAWRHREARVWVVFSLVVLVFYTVVKTRLPHYVAPVYPAMAVVTGAFLSEKVQYLRMFSLRKRLAIFIAVATVWGGGLALTAGARKRLHSAPGAGGWTSAEEREAVGLLRDTRNSSVDGPLLTWWTEGRRSVATSVFYSGRTVQQVQSGTMDPTASRQRYTSDLHPLEQAVGERPANLLVETRLLRQLPAEFVYSRVAAGPTMEFGTIRRRSATEAAPSGKDTR